MSWVITKPEEYFVAIGGDGPITRLAPNFNGVSQKGLLPSNVTLISGNTVRFKASKPAIDFATVIDSVSRSFRLRYRAGGTIQIEGLSGTVNGQPITSLSTVWPDGISEFELTLNTGGDINSIGSRSDTDSSFFDGLIFDFVINDGSVYNFPMDDGWANNPVMRNAATGARQRYWFSGTDDYMTIPQVDLIVGDTVEFKFIAPTDYSTVTTTAYVLDVAGSVSNPRGFIKFTPSGALDIDSASVSVTLDGSPMADGALLPDDGNEHTMVVTYKDSDSLVAIGGRNDGLFASNFPIYDIDIKQGGATPLRFYAVNKGSGSNVIDSVNGQNGTIVNHKEAAWTSADNGNGKYINMTEASWVEIEE